MEWDAEGQGGMGWNGVKCSGMEWDGMAWTDENGRKGRDGVEWMDGMGQSDLRYDGMG